MQADNERLKLQHQKRIEAANLLLRNQELDCNQMLKHLH